MWNGSPRLRRPRWKRGVRSDGRFEWAVLAVRVGASSEETLLGALNRVGPQMRPTSPVPTNLAHPTCPRGLAPWCHRCFLRARPKTRAKCCATYVLAQNLSLLSGCQPWCRGVQTLASCSGWLGNSFRHQRRTAASLLRCLLLSSIARTESAVSTSISRRQIVTGIAAVVAHALPPSPTGQFAALAEDEVAKVGREVGRRRRPRREMQKDASYF